MLVVHGPNLNLLGQREPHIYGRTGLKEINSKLVELAAQLGLTVDTFQSNSEGAIIDRIQQARNQADAVLINPGGYTHTSVAIRDALQTLDAPVIEVHLSNLYRREPFRHHSTIADIVVGRVMGFGADSYMLALRAVPGLIADQRTAPRK